MTFILGANLAFGALLAGVPAAKQALKPFRSCAGSLCRRICVTIRSEEKCEPKKATVPCASLRDGADSLPPFWLASEGRFAQTDNAASC